MCVGTVMGWVADAARELSAADAAGEEGEQSMTFILWLIAVAIGIYGVLRVIRGDILIGIVIIIVALLVGPGGVSVFN